MAPLHIFVVVICRLALCDIIRLFFFYCGVQRVSNICDLTTDVAIKICDIKCIFIHSKLVFFYCMIIQKCSAGYDVSFYPLIPIDMKKINVLYYQNSIFGVWLKRSKYTVLLHANLLLQLPLQFCIIRICTYRYQSARLFFCKVNTRHPGHNRYKCCCCCLFLQVRLHNMAMLSSSS